MQPSTLHPILVGFPLAFLSFSFIIDVMNLVPTSVTQTFEPYLTRYTLAHDTLNTLSFSLSAAGILASIPAIMTGTREALNLARTHMTKVRGQHDVRRAVKNTFVEARTYPNSEARLMGHAVMHALLNHAVVSIAAYNWWTRRHEWTYELPKHPNSVLSLAGLVVLLASVGLGASLMNAPDSPVKTSRKGKEKVSE